MGKKYALLKEELARNPVRDLLVINDRLVRQSYFAQASDVLKKIDKMEVKIRDFHSKDQKLFDQWYKLTFRKDQKEVDETQAKFKTLARFHNWIIATARMLDIGMAEAYLLMKEEESRYARGGLEEKREIESKRAKRDKFVEEDSQERYNEEPQFETDDESEEAEAHPLSQIMTHLEDLVLPEDREPGLEMPARMDRIMALSDDEFRFWLDDDEVAFLLFDLSLSWGESRHEFSGFLRMWKLMSHNQKKTFSEVYYTMTGQSLESFVKGLERDGVSEESNESEFEFNEEFIDFGPGRRSEPKISPAQEEKLKGLYRKLIRKLHPDLQASAPPEEQTEWIKRIWNQVQKAYCSKDVDSLERLFSLTLLRLNALEQLTLDEIQEAKRWLQKDLSTLEEEAKHLKKSMAWGFSAKKDYSALNRKIKREFERTVAAVRAQIEEMRHEHRVLEVLATSDSPGPRRRKRKNSRQRPRGPRGSQRRHRHDDNQESFSFD